jgi:hypothetical protein
MIVNIEEEVEEEEVEVAEEEIEAEKEAEEEEAEETEEAEEAEEEEDTMEVKVMQMRIKLILNLIIDKHISKTIKTTDGKEKLLTVDSGRKMLQAGEVKILEKRMGMEDMVGETRTMRAIRLKTKQQEKPLRQSRNLEKIQKLLRKKRKLLFQLKRKLTIKLMLNTKQRN